MAAAKKRVVVVGGGIAGAHTVKALENRADLILIDPKEYFEIPWASLRCIVEPAFAERSIFLHKEYLKTAKLITDTVTGTTDDTVVTASGERIPFDYLVLATGSTYEGPPAMTQRLKQFEADHKKVKDAGTILIIGGGPTGVELAGEIAVDFPKKKVILVHGGPRLIEFLGPKASKKALDWLKHKNVEVLLDERIDLEGISKDSARYATSSGKIISADCHFVCVGRRVGSSWLKESAFRDWLDEQGRLKVDENLRIEGKLNVFAAGDIVNVKEAKQGFFAQKHAEVIAENIKKLSKNPSHNKLSTYKPGPALGIVSLGRSVAVAQLPFGTLSGRLPGMIKSKDLFVGKTRKGLGVTSQQFVSVCNSL